MVGTSLQFALVTMAAQSLVGILISTVLPAINERVGTTRAYFVCELGYCACMVALGLVHGTSVDNVGGAGNNSSGGSLKQPNFSPSEQWHILLLTAVSGAVFGFHDNNCYVLVEDLVMDEHTRGRWVSVVNLTLTWAQILVSTSSGFVIEWLGGDVQRFIVYSAAVCFVCELLLILAYAFLFCGCSGGCDCSFVDSVSSLLSLASPRAAILEVLDARESRYYSKRGLVLQEQPPVQHSSSSSAAAAKGGPAWD
eukprot:g2325.t1